MNCLGLQLKDGNIYKKNNYRIGVAGASTFMNQFIKKLKNGENHIGTNLLKYVLDNKEICENFFKMKFEFSYLDNRCSKSFCKASGYKENRNDMMSRSI